MHSRDEKKFLLVSMPFAGTGIPSVQLSLLKNFLLENTKVNVEDRHLYLKAAEVYGLKNYNFLINDSYSAQVVFSKFVFPEVWKKNKEKIKSFFENNFLKENSVVDDFCFESFVDRTDKFFRVVLRDYNWDGFDFVGFSLNYGQFLPSLALAKKIKRKNPEVKIVFGGSRTSGVLGVKTLEVFDFVDYVVSGEGEKSLEFLVDGSTVLDDVPGLIYRGNNKVRWNQKQEFVDLNDLPFLSFDSFFKELSTCSGSVQEYFQFYGRLPLEVSRGCWWNRCSFCNLNMLHSGYREKNSDRLVEEVAFLSDRYKILSFQLLGSVLPRCYRDFALKIKDLDQDFSFFAEARAGKLKRKDYHLLKQAGFHDLQTGIESFSSSYLEKMNKGVRVIDNVAALKFCREMGINNLYNIVVGFPNEDKNDFLETKRNIAFFKHFIDPPNISRLMIGVGCPIFKNPSFFDADELVNCKIDQLMFPEDVLDSGLSFYYDLKSEKDVDHWKKLVDDWSEIRQSYKRDAVEKNSVVDKKVFFCVDGGSFLRVYDKRNGQLRVFVLDDFERQVFLSCLDVVSFDSLKNRFFSVEEFKLAGVLRTLEKAGIVFSEDNYFLSLPLMMNTERSSLCPPVENDSLKMDKVLDELA